MHIYTQSGSEYLVFVGEKALSFRRIRDGFEGHCVAIFPNREKFLQDTVTVTTKNGVTEGFNAAGIRTAKFELRKIEVGMILANRRGFRSSPITKIVGGF